MRMHVPKPLSSMDISLTVHLLHWGYQHPAKPVAASGLRPAESRYSASLDVGARLYSRTTPAAPDFSPLRLSLTASRGCSSHLGWCESWSIRTDCRPYPTPRRGSRLQGRHRPPCARYYAA